MTVNNLVTFFTEHGQILVYVKKRLNLTEHLDG